jgi:hypothetical protein
MVFILERDEKMKREREKALIATNAQLQKVKIKVKNIKPRRKSHESN